MPIPVSCDCGKKLNAPDAMAGKRAKCPGCQRPLLIPEALEVIDEGLEVAASPPAVPPRAGPSARNAPGAGAPPRREDVPARIGSAFTAAKIEPVRQPLGYRVSALVVAFLMVLLPLIYLAMIVGVAGLVWWHTTSNTWLLGGGVGGTRNSGKAMIFSLLLYITPMVAGGIMILFMLKPLFARAAPKPGWRSLKDGEEPVLFDFVERICAAVGSPKPRRIDIDNEVNASASFRSGWLSFFGNDLVLTIGMPLAAGLTMRQFGGVLAHEFGHFSQGAGMRLTFVIRSVNFWFQRVVHERDEWDEWLLAWSSSLDIRIGWVLYVARACVWLSRGVLWLLMMVGHFFSGVLMRQMEFDADRHEARFAGSDTFASTARQLRLLGIANGGAMSDLADFYREGRLCDDMPTLIMHNAGQLPASVREGIDKEIVESRTGFFDTHPADSARIANAEREEAEGIFRLEWPAALLFRDFSARAREVTLDFYRQVLGDKLDESDIHPVSELMDRQKAEQESIKALKRFHQSAPLLHRQLPEPREISRAVTDAAAVADRLGKARALAQKHVPSYLAVRKTYEQSHDILIEAGIAGVLLDVGLPVGKGDFKRNLSTRKAASDEQAKATADRENLAAQMSPFETANAARLYSAVRLAQTPEYAPDVASAGFKGDEISRLAGLLVEISEAVPNLLSLWDDKLALERLASFFENHANSNDKLVPRFKEIVGVMRGKIAAIQEAFKAHPYPFDHANKNLSIGEYLVKELPAEDEAGEIHSAAEKAVDYFANLHARVLGRLCQAAEVVETRLGFKPLPDPAEDSGQEAG